MFRNVQWGNLSVYQKGDQQGDAKRTVAAAAAVRGKKVKGRRRASSLRTVRLSLSPIFLLERGKNTSRRTTTKKRSNPS